MQKLTLVITNSENVGIISDDDLVKFQEIMTALITSGGLTGVKGGSTIIHFDALGDFQGVQLDYWPYRRRSQKK